MFLAWKEIKKNKGKYAIVTLVLVATMFLVLFTIGLSSGLQRLGASKIMDSPAETFILKEDSNSSIEASSFSDLYAYEVMQELNDDEALILGANMGNVQNISSETESDVFGAAYFGLEGENFMTPNIIEGRTAQGPSEAVASSYMKNEGVKLGDTIHDVDQNIEFTIVGFSEDETFNYSPIIYLSPDQFDQTSFAGQALGFSYVQAVVTQMPPEEIPASIHEYDVEVNSKDEIIQNTPGLFAQSVSFFLLVVCMYIISGTILAMFFYIITLQKKREYGQLKAFGASTKYLAKTIITQVTIIVLISLVLAVLLILLTSVLLPEVVPFRYDNSYVIISSIMFLVVSLLGSFASLYQISNVDPIIAIGGNN